MTIPVKTPKVATSDLKLEAVVIPVADVDRAKQFYEKLGWRLDADFMRPDGSRAVQLTPPGSPTSIQLGKGPVYPRYLVVDDIEAARAELIAQGVEVSDIFHPGNGPGGRVSGLDPGAEELLVACDLHRSRQQSLAAAGSHTAVARPRQSGQDRIQLVGRACGRAAARRRRAWRA